MVNLPPLPRPRSRIGVSGAKKTKSGDEAFPAAAAVSGKNFPSSGAVPLNNSDRDGGEIDKLKKFLQEKGL